MTTVVRPRSSGATNRPSSRTGYKVSSGKYSQHSQEPPAGRNANIPNIGNDSKRQIVGQYMLGKTIGEGTFGKVKLAVHMPSGEKVAVKILEKSRIKESADVRRVNREIKILKKARHCNVIQLYEVLDTPSAIYLIMECAEGYFRLFCS
jgi:serine/threonine protein kinase